MSEAHLRVMLDERLDVEFAVFDDARYYGFVARKSELFRPADVSDGPCDDVLSNRASPLRRQQEFQEALGRHYDHTLLVSAV